MHSVSAPIRSFCSAMGTKKLGPITPSFEMRPTRERFSTADLARLDLHLRLVVGHHVAAVQGMAKVCDRCQHR